MAKLSNEQILKAREVDLLAYLQRYEPDSIRQNGAGEYYLTQHDSLKISNGKWFRHSTQEGGHSALDFLIKVRGIPFVDAVQSLTSGYVFTDYQPKIAPRIRLPPKAKPFILPTPNKNNDKVVAYLRGRGIDRDIIHQAISSGAIYESIKHRCIFVGKDENGIAKYACERGIVDNLKKDVSGSSKQYGFCLPPRDPHGEGRKTLALFESAIDTLAHTSIHALGQTGWDGYRLSLGGISSQALNGFLKRYPKISSIQLSLDNDKAGQVATSRIIKELLSGDRHSHIKVFIALPPIGKDWGDTVQAIKQNNINKSVGRPPEAVF